MRALIYDRFQGPVSLSTVPDPEAKAGSVVVQVQASGLCLSDWHGWMGHDADIRLPHVPGHEFAGTIAEVGAGVPGFKVGDRVTVPFVGGCGHCAQCRSGNQQICDAQFQPGFTAWGSFAQYVEIEYAQNNLVRIPDSMDFVTAASLGCRFATSFRAVVDQGAVRGGQWVAVFGCGGVGLSAIMIASAMGARVIAIDIQDARLEFAKSLGAVAAVNSTVQTDVAGAIGTLSGGGVRLSIDAIGAPGVIVDAVNSLAKRGRHVQIGLLPPSEAQTKIPMDRIIANELELAGSHGLQAYRYRDMLAMIEAGRLHPEKLIGRTVSLSRAADLLPKLNSSRETGVQIVTKFS